MTNFNLHYKDKDPKETINIIKQFFQDKKLVIKEEHFIQSEVNTYSCGYSLYYNNKRILHTNGKGITKEFCQASGLSELYERFCGSINYFDLSPITYSLINNNGNNDIQDIYLQKLYQLHSIKSINFIFNNNFNITLYYSCNQKKYINKNYQAIRYYLGTTGLATGNTIEEALVQGCSELFERYTIEQFFQKEQSEYFYLKKENLNSILKEKITLMEQAGYNVKLYDLSYNFNTPVCMLFIINKKTHQFYYNFGSAPIFDIAAERSITEMYQGHFNLIDQHSINIITKTEKDKQINAFQQFHSSISDHHYLYIPDWLLLKSKEINHYNTMIFLNKEKEYNNQTLFNHLIDIGKINNLNFAYRDISISDKIKAIHIINEDLIYTYTRDIYHNSNNINNYNNYITATILIINKLKYYCNNIVSNLELENDLNNLLNIINKLNINIYDFFNFGFFNNRINQIFNPYSLTNIGLSDTTYQNIYYIYTGQYENIDFPQNNIFKEKYELYFLYLSYLDLGYNEEKIKNILSQLNYNITYIKNNFQQMTAIEVIKYIFIDTLYEIYNSNEYKEFLKMIII